MGGPAGRFAASLPGRRIGSINYWRGMTGVQKRDNGQFFPYCKKREATRFTTPASTFQYNPLRKNVARPVPKNNICLIKKRRTIVTDLLRWASAPASPPQSSGVLKQFLISLLFLFRPLCDGFFVHPGVVEVAVHFGQFG
jgi:hypothetical protein